jgi:hypothetical protein
MSQARQESYEMSGFTTVPRDQLTESFIGDSSSGRGARWSVRKHVLVGGGVFGLLMAMMIIYLYAAGYTESDQEQPLGSGWRRFLEGFANKMMEGGVGEEAATGLSHTVSNIALEGAGVGAGCLVGYAIASCRRDDSENYGDEVEVEGEGRKLLEEQSKLLDNLQKVLVKMQQGLTSHRGSYASICSASHELQPLVLQLACHLLHAVMRYDFAQLLNENSIARALQAGFPHQDKYIETHQEDDVPKGLREACKTLVTLCYFQAEGFFRECERLSFDVTSDLRDFRGVMNRYIFGLEGDLMRVVLRFSFISEFTFAGGETVGDFAAKWNHLDQNYRQLLNSRGVAPEEIGGIDAGGQLVESRSEMMLGTDRPLHRVPKRISRKRDDGDASDSASESEFSSTTGTGTGGATPASDGGRSGAGGGGLRQPPRLTVSDAAVPALAPFLSDVESFRFLPQGNSGAGAGEGDFGGGTAFAVESLGPPRQGNLDAVSGGGHFGSTVRLSSSRQSSRNFANKR